MKRKAEEDFGDFEPPPAKRPNRKERPMKLFIGNVDQKVTEELLLEYIAKFGEVKEFRLMPSDSQHSKSGFQHRGFGFLKFYSNEDAKKFANEVHHFEGKMLNVKEAIPETRQFFVGGISRDRSTEASLREWFEKYGEISEIHVNARGGFAFVTLYDEHNNLQQTFNGRKRWDIDGNMCEVRIARPPQEHYRRQRGRGRRFDNLGPGYAPLPYGLPPPGMPGMPFWGEYDMTQPAPHDNLYGRGGPLAGPGPGKDEAAKYWNNIYPPF